MKKEKSVLVSLLAFLSLVLLPSSVILAEEGYEDYQGDDYWYEDYQEDDYWYEDYQEDDYWYEDYQEDDYEEETEEPIPESYYYPIESNEIDNWPQGPEIEAASAVVMDMDTGVFLYSKQATETQYPASITKIMTTLLLIENCDLNDTITFSEVVYDVEEGSSHIGIQPGEEMTLRDCAYAIMLESANDAANGVAEYIAGSISGFADMMNEKAAELGCVNTHFSNPHGLYSDDHYTCAYDMALIAQAAYANETFREIVGAEEYTIPETNLTDEERYLTNHHQMLNSDSEYFHEWCTGGKTGYTSQCLNTLVTFFEQDGRNLVAVVMRVNGSGKAYLESTDILNYAYENFYTRTYLKDQAEETFYDVMGLGYVGTAAQFLPSEWERAPYENCSVSFTLPSTVTPESVTITVDETSLNSRTFTYEYNGYTVGTASGKLNSPFLPVQPILQVGTNASTTQDMSSGGIIQMEEMDEVLDSTIGFLERTYNAFMNYASENTVLVLTIGAVLMVFLIILIIVLIFRSTSDARIRRKRKLEDEEVRKKEEEIEQMTTEEIEAELRAAMEEEERRKEEEAQAQAEAEKAAKEAEEMEWKAKETERLIDELEQERQERIASGKDNSEDLGKDSSEESEEK